MRGALFLIIALAAGPLWAQTNESLEFSGPSNAPIYVIDGDFHYDETWQGLSMMLDWSGSMDPATGIFSGNGDFSASGSYASYSIDWDGTISARQVDHLRRRDDLRVSTGSTGSGFIPHESRRECRHRPDERVCGLQGIRQGPWQNRKFFFAENLLIL
ncbi:MAG: hypothetical protein EBS53_03205 [Bacteroidetes bacterium]|nr:hypothetical protein [Bacteroidota bacterium]